MKIISNIVASLLALSLIPSTVGLAEEKEVSSPKNSAEIKAPFLYGLGLSRAGERAEVDSLERANEWLNSPPLAAADLKGKVVLIEFWTYSCINWLRQLPYVRAWAAKYKDRGLVVIGVHAPEFGFEKIIANVRWAVKEMRVDYPVAVDNDHSIWRSFRNKYWPALYFIDAQGRVRHHHFGEGSYEQSERVIQQLLAEAGTDSDRKIVAVTPSGIEAPADWRSLKSAERYIGYERAQSFMSPGIVARNMPRHYRLPEMLRLNEWGLSGDWTVKNEAAALISQAGSIAYRFHARDLHLVMGRSEPGQPVKFRVRIDGQRPGGAHGADIDEDGNGTVNEQRLYQLIRQPGPITDRHFEIEFLSPSVEAFAFTFG